MIPILQLAPTELFQDFFGYAFGGTELAGAVLFIVAMVFLFKKQVPLAGILPIGLLLMYALWQSFHGLFDALWVVALILVLAVSAFGVWQSFNK